MAKCEMCGKGPQFGYNVSHSKKATKRQFKPNIQRRRLEIDGEMRRVYICTRCLRTLNKTSRDIAAAYIWLGLARKSPAAMLKSILRRPCK